MKPNALCPRPVKRAAFVATVALQPAPIGQYCRRATTLAVLTERVNVYQTPYFRVETMESPKQPATATGAFGATRRANAANYFTYL